MHSAFDLGHLKADIFQFYLGREHPDFRKLQSELLSVPIGILGHSVER
jgi:hypothetical protein